MSKETVEDVKVISPGAILKAAREKQGLSIEEVADQLHLRFTIIKELEQDHYATDISATFTKGYLKLYSKLLGVDENKVLNAYQQLGTQEKEPARLQSFSQKVARQASDQRLMWVTYLVLALVAAGVIVWWVQQDDTSISRFIDSSVATSDEVSKPAALQNGDSDPAETNNLMNESAIESVNTNINANTSESSTGIQQGANNDSADITESNTETELTQSSQQTPEPQTLEEQSSELGAELTQLTTEPDNSTLQDTIAATDDKVQLDEPSEIVAEQQQPSETVTGQEQEQEQGQTNEASVFAALEAPAESTTTIARNDTQTNELSSNLPLADPVELVFTFSGDCWMKLTDATGEDVAYGIKQAGRIMPVSGIPPFEVVLGAPESVQISYAGDAIDMARFRPGYTARFQLPLSE